MRETVFLGLLIIVGKDLSAFLLTPLTPLCILRPVSVTGAMQDIVVSQSSIGLSEYAEKFVEMISIFLIPDLTDQDLKELGISSLGHRRKLLRAITQLRTGETTALQPLGMLRRPRSAQTNCGRLAGLRTRWLHSRKLAVAERRQLTVTFCELVGSLAPGAGLTRYPTMLPSIRPWIRQRLRTISCG
jgi:SAM domain (Sterile alpha motif)